MCLHPLSVGMPSLEWWVVQQIVGWCHGLLAMDRANTAGPNGMAVLFVWGPEVKSEVKVSVRVLVVLVLVLVLVLVPVLWQTSASGLACLARWDVEAGVSASALPDLPYSPAACRDAPVFVAWLQQGVVLPPHEVLQTSGRRGA